MGAPKAWLKFDGRPLLNYLVERMLTVFPEVVVVSASGQALPVTDAHAVCDEHPDEGPLAGLAAGLRAISQPVAFVSSCDAPFLDPQLARALVDLADDFDAVVPEWEGRLQPLHAVYRATVQPIVVGQLANGRRRMMDLLGLLQTRVVTHAELQRLGAHDYSFWNMNTPEEYQRALELWNTKCA